jgi:hypothetical protein
MIKDLKAKVEHLESTIATAQREGVVPGTAAATATGMPRTSHGPAAAPGLGSPGGFPMTDISTMSAQELRARFLLVHWKLFLLCFNTFHCCECLFLSQVAILGS